MNQGPLFSIFLSAAFAFGRYRFTAMGKHSAEGGLAAAVLLIMIDLFMPNMRPEILPAVLFVMGLVCVGGAVDLWFRQKPIGAVETIKAVPNVSTPGAKIKNNSGIITEGQRGNNTIFK